MEWEEDPVGLNWLLALIEGLKLAPLVLAVFVLVVLLVALRF